jgi:zinc-binding alcohol dehydrogenase/oxidoreductase
MLAWRLTECPGDATWGTVVDPEPGPGEVRLRVRASALNHMDHWLTRGTPRPPDVPHVPGNDVAGVVESVGSGVDAWVVGDEVVANTCLVPVEALTRGVDAVLDTRLRLLGEHCWGGHGELCVVPAHHLARKPPHRSWAEVAASPICAATAWRLLRRARVAAGECVLVTGIGGGVATAAMMIALHLGARVVVTSRDPAKRERAVALGAAAAYPSDEPLPEPVDVAIDSIGPAVWDHVVDALVPGGRLGVCGGTSGRTVELHLPKLFWRQHEIIGGTGGSQVEFDEVVRMLDDGLRVVVDEVVALDEYPRALDRLRAGEQFGKIVLEHPA